MPAGRHPAAPSPQPSAPGPHAPAQHTTAVRGRRRTTIPRPHAPYEAPHLTSTDRIHGQATARPHHDRPLRAALGDLHSRARPVRPQPTASYDRRPGRTSRPSKARTPTARLFRTTAGPERPSQPSKACTPAARLFGTAADLGDLHGQARPVRPRSTTSYCRRSTPSRTHSRAGTAQPQPTAS